MWPHTHSCPHDACIFVMMHRHMNLHLLHCRNMSCLICVVILCLCSKCGTFNAHVILKSAYSMLRVWHSGMEWVAGTHGKAIIVPQPMDHYLGGRGCCRLPCPVMTGFAPHPPTMPNTPVPDLPPFIKCFRASPGGPQTHTTFFLVPHAKCPSQGWSRSPHFSLPVFHFCPLLPLHPYHNPAAVGCCCWCWACQELPSALINGEGMRMWKEGPLSTTAFPPPA